MPSTDLDGARFTAVEWDEVRSRRRLPDGGTAGLLLGLVCVAALFAYDYVVSPVNTIPVLRWDFGRVDWLLLVAGVFLLRYGVVPLVDRRDLSSRGARALLGHPAAVLGMTYLLVFAIVGLAGTERFFPLDYPRLKYHHQPPVFTSLFVGDQFTYNCFGQLVGERCHGSWRYPLGTNRRGQNVLKLVSFGMNTALKLGVATATVMVVLATTVGTAAGYVGGWVDEVLMRYVDIQQTLPAIVVYLVLGTLYYGNVEGMEDAGLFTFVLVFGLLDWGGMARLIRSDVLGASSAGYVRAARAAGASDLQVLRRHVVPNSWATIVTALTRRIPLLILAQTALAFLELNRINSRSFGYTLLIGLGGQDMAWHRKWWVTTFPLVALVLTVVAFNVIGDALRDVFDPQEEVE